MPGWLVVDDRRRQDPNRTPPHGHRPGWEGDTDVDQGSDVGTAPESQSGSVPFNALGEMNHDELGEMDHDELGRVNGGDAPELHRQVTRAPPSWPSWSASAWATQE